MSHLASTFTLHVALHCSCVSYFLKRQPQYGRDTCSHIHGSGFRCRRLLGSTASSQTSGEQKHRDLIRLIDKNDVVCFQETCGKDEFPQALQVLRTQFRMFVTFVPGNVNAGGSSIFIRENLLTELSSRMRSPTRPAPHYQSSRWQKPPCDSQHAL